MPWQAFAIMRCKINQTKSDPIRQRPFRLRMHESRCRAGAYAGRADTGAQRGRQVSNTAIFTGSIPITGTYK